MSNKPRSALSEVMESWLTHEGCQARETPVPPPVWDLYPTWGTGTGFSTLAAPLPPGQAVPNTWPQFQRLGASDPARFPFVEISLKDTGRLHQLSPLTQSPLSNHGEAFTLSFPAWLRSSSPRKDLTGWTKQPVLSTKSLPQSLQGSSRNQGALEQGPNTESTFKTFPSIQAFIILSHAFPTAADVVNAACGVFFANCYNALAASSATILPVLSQLPWVNANLAILSVKPGFHLGMQFRPGRKSCPSINFYRYLISSSCLSEETLIRLQ